MKELKSFTSEQFKAMTATENSKSFEKQLNYSSLLSKYYYKSNMKEWSLSSMQECFIPAWCEYHKINAARYYERHCSHVNGYISVLHIYVHVELRKDKPYLRNGKPLYDMDPIEWMIKLIGGVDNVVDLDGELYAHWAMEYQD